ncbi:hypothetical protein IFM89_031129 [Coptis chinensis]|uniref:Cation/H+ exchanger domain-containing protein n=1 Tax=Coptis chinensis TaxID=261450 RepID=A0A835IRD0_9MAGN|nr:hypothetical protein IFM89_031129 [Coptis chinensis]
MAGKNTTYQPVITEGCDFIHSAISFGIFSHNPLKFSFPVLEIQLFIASFTAIIISVLLKPLGIPTTVSQIFAGIILGPSCLSRFKGLRKMIFPRGSFLTLEVYASLGLVYQTFLTGVQMNHPRMILKAGRKAILICVLVFVIPSTLSIACATLMSSTTKHVDTKLYRNLIIVGLVESIPAFPAIAGHLSELNIFNTEFSHLALSSSLISGILYFSIMTIVVAFDGVVDHFLLSIIIVTGCISLVMMIIIFILRPALKWMIKQIPDEKAVKEAYFCFVVVAVMMLACLSSFLSLDILFGPFFFGVIIPPGPPLGTTLVDRLQFLNTWMIMPIFCVQNGMMMDIFRFDLRTVLHVGLIVLLSCTGKFLGAFLPALYYNMSYKDAILLGLTMNAQGFLDLSFFQVLHGLKIIDRVTFQIMVMSSVITTGASAPLMRYLYKSSMNYNLHSKRTIQHSEPNTELRILACIHHEQNALSMIHLLKATNPTKFSPINLSIIHFVEIVGHETPILISHKVHRKFSSATTASQSIMNVFRYYEQNNQGRVSVQPYTVVSAYASMHTDACKLALSKLISLIILPFHRQLATGTVNGGIRAMNRNVLQNAPCSVGILIDRGVLGGIKFVLENWSSYHVAVIFLGGPDDREALAYVERMSEHPNVEVTVIRFLMSSNEYSKIMESSLDDETVSEFNLKTEYNDRVTYIEEEVNDGLGVINVIDAMGNKYEMIILGRRHDDNSPLILELTDWDKCSELGTIGDIFETSNYGGNATILVMQQQAKETAGSRDFSQDDKKKTKSDMTMC